MSDNLIDQIARLEQHTLAVETAKEKHRRERLERLEEVNRRLEESNRKLNHQVKQSDVQLKQLKQLNPKRMQEQIKRLQREKQEQQGENQRLIKQLVEYKQRCRKAEEEAKEQSKNTAEVPSDSEQKIAEKASKTPASKTHDLLWTDERFSIERDDKPNTFIVTDIENKISRSLSVKDGEIVVPKVRPISATVRKQVMGFSKD